MIRSISPLLFRRTRLYRTVVHRMLFLYFFRGQGCSRINMSVHLESIRSKFQFQLFIIQQTRSHILTHPCPVLGLVLSLSPNRPHLTIHSGRTDESYTINSNKRSFQRVNEIRALTCDARVYYVDCQTLKIKRE